MMNNFQEHILHRQNMKDPVYRAEYELKQEEIKKAYWMSLDKFVDRSDVPDLPTDLTEFYINRLIELGAIPIENMINGKWYYGEHRRAQIAKWDSELGKFEYWRDKFGGVYLDNCNHFQNDDGFALFVPLRLANNGELENIKKIEDEKL